MKETANRTSSSEYQVCKPLSPEHRRGGRWFSALTHAVEGQAEDRAQIQHCIQFYSCYAESGDGRYLTLCEDFLKYAIRSMERAPADE